jgi:phytoene dehydrogenase-like protein
MMAHVIIVGGGVTGLSAGIHLLEAGHGKHRVTVCESGAVPGGNLTGWDRDGYHIDNCVHWLTGTNPATKTYDMWCRLGALGGVEVRQLNSLFTCRYGGQSLSLYRDLERTRQAMLALSPQDRRETEAFFRAVRAVQGLCGIAGPAHDGKVSPADVGAMPGLLRYHRMDTRQLADRFRHPLLRCFMRSLCGDCFSAAALLMVIAHFCGENGDLPAGGSRAMAQRMADRLTSLGGRLRLRQPVERVNMVGSGTPLRATSVSLTGGATLAADYVIITADPRSVCGKRLAASLPPSLEKQYRDPASLRFSAVHAAFGVPVGTLTFSGDLVMDIPPAQRKTVGSGQVVFREFSHEPSFAPPGQVVVQAMAFCTEQVARQYLALTHTPVAYAQKKQAVAAVFEQLLEDACPAVAGKLRLLDVWTPATYKRFTGSEIGSFMSFVLRPGDAFWKRTDGRIPGVKNVLLAGQWLHAPGGLPIAAGEGQRAAAVAQRYLERQAVTERHPAHIRISFS